MRSIRAALLATLLVATSIPSAVAAPPTPGPAPAARPAGGPTPGDVVPGRFLVRYERLATKADRAAARQAMGIGDGPKRGRALKLVPDLELVQADLTLDELKGKLRGKRGIQSIEPDRYIGISALPNDPYFSDSWGLRQTDDHDIDAPEAWTITRGAGVVVAVLDTGVDLDHPDLAANAWTNDDEIAGNGLDDDDNGYVDDVEGWDYVDDDADPSDEHWHGTHVAGTIAAVRDNGIGTVGVAPEARIMALRVLDENGSGTIGESVAAIDYAVRNGARVLNLSWTWFGYPVQPVEDVLAAASDAGVVIAAAAGNDGFDTDGEPLFPAGIDVPGLISVGAIDIDDDLWSGSNRGRASVDVTAPGVDVLATIPGNDWAYATGTSMATPHVAGVAALLVAQHPDWSAAKIRSRIMQTARPLSGLAGKIASGGTLDAAAALVGAVDKPPVVTITAPTAPAEALPGATVTLTATAVDPEDGDVAPSIVWASSLQGALGSGGSIQRADLEPGEHVITAMAADSAGHRPIASRLLRIGPKRLPVDRTPDDRAPAIAVTAAGVPSIAFARTERGIYLATPSGSTWSRTLIGPSEGDHWPSIDLTSTGQPRVAAMRTWSFKLTTADPGVMVYRPDGGGWAGDRASFTCIGGDEGCGRDWTPSLVLDAEGREHIATVRLGLPSGGPNEPTSGLAYLRRLENGGWATQIVDGAPDIQVADLALAPSGAVHIVYLRVGATAPGVWHVTNETGSWVKRRLSTSTTQIWPSVAVDATGRVRVAVASPTAVSLRTRTGTTWDAWVTVRAGSAGAVDVAVDGAGKVHLVAGLGDATQTAAGVAYITSAGSGWALTTIQTGQASQPRLALDGAGKVHVAYQYVGGVTGPAIRYATNASGAWAVSTVSAGRNANGPGYAIDGRGVAHAVTAIWGAAGGTSYGSNESGAWQMTRISTGTPVDSIIPAIAVTATGEAHVVYTITAQPGASIPRAVWYATNVTGRWVATRLGGHEGAAHPRIRLDQAGKVHIVWVGMDAGGSGLFYATDASGSIVVKRLAGGQNAYPSLALDANGKRHIAVVRVGPGPDLQRDLRYFTDKNGSWTSGTITSSTGIAIEPSIAIDPQGDPAIAFHLAETGLYLAQREGGVWSTRTVNDDDAAMFPDLVIDSDGTRRIVYSIADGDYDRCQGLPLGCIDYPGLKQATASTTGPWSFDTLSFAGQDLFADLDRGRDGSLGLAFHDGAGISELRLQRTKKATTTIVYQGPTSGRKGTSVTLKAKLTVGTTPQVGRTITFKLDGVVLGAATTDAGGVATKTVTLTATAGSHRLTAGFSGVAGFLAARAGPLTFTVQP